MVTNVNTHIPVTFEKIETIDDRFTKLKIWLMHTEENLNKSFFSRESVKAAIPTLANTPILGYLEENKEGELDYSDHRSVLAREDGRWTIKYVAQAFGVIPENCNPQLETKMCEDGIEREFLTCEGLIWNKWDDPVDVLNRDGTKAQSMEIHEDYSGEFDKDGIFHFSTFKFFGACILGKAVEPAMTGADVSVAFTQEDIFKEIHEKMDEYKLLVASKSTNQGGVDMAKKVENVPVVEPVTEPAKVVTEPAPSPANFSLTAQQLARGLAEELADEGGVNTDAWGWECPNYWYVDHTDTQVICYNSDFDLVGFTYTVNVDIVEIDMASGVELKVVYAPIQGNDTDDVGESFVKSLAAKAKAAFEAIVQSKTTVETEVVSVKAELVTTKEAFTALKGEVEQLREFKTNAIVSERKSQLDEMFSRFPQLTEEEVAALKTEAYSSDMEIDSIEIHLFALVGKKNANFTAPTTKSKTVRIELPPIVNEPVSGKPYAEIVNKYSTKK